MVFFIKHIIAKAFVKIGNNFIKGPTHPVIYTFYNSTSQKDHVNAFIGNYFANGYGIRLLTSTFLVRIPKGLLFPCMVKHFKNCPFLIATFCLFF